MSRPWYRLNIDISNAVRADFDFDKLYTDSEFANKPAGLWQFNSKTLTNLFNDSWIDYLKSTGFPITGAMLFYRAPYFIHPQAHIDVRATGIKSIYGVNWVINDNDDSEMIWYDTPAIGGINEKSEAGTLYTYWSLDNINDLEISRLSIGNTPTLVQVDIPHNVIVKSNARWAVSLRFPVDDSIQTWSDAVDKYMGLIV